VNQFRTILAAVPAKRNILMQHDPEDESG
jgi:hypothetical protein